MRRTVNEWRGLSRHSKIGILLVAAIGFALVLAATVLVFVLRETHDDLTIQQRGRARAVPISCTILRSIVDSGVDSIKGGTLLPGDRLTSSGEFVPGPLTRQLGSVYPSYPERQERAQTGADAYERRIADAIRRVTKTGSPPLTHGRLDCRKLAELTDAQPPR